MPVPDRRLLLYRASLISALETSRVSIIQCLTRWSMHRNNRHLSTSLKASVIRVFHTFAAKLFQCLRQAPTGLIPASTAILSPLFCRCQALLPSHRYRLALRPRRRRHFFLPLLPRHPTSYLHTRCLLSFYSRLLSSSFLCDAVSSIEPPTSPLLSSQPTDMHRR